MSSTNLPGELVDEILIWLPVQSLLRFRCVAKSWRALIDSSNFIKSHLSRNLKSKCYIFRLEYKSHRDAGLEVKLINLSTQVLDSIISPSLVLFESINLPISSPEILGTCNGLIALKDYRSNEIILVNPSTREYQLLPPFGEFSYLLGYGVGYDCFADEYKVVVKQLKVDPIKGVEVNIWGSKSKTWRKISCSLNYTSYMNFIHYSCHGKYTHGALHWILGDPLQLTNSTRTNRIQIEAFDLLTEKFMCTEYNREVFGYPVGVELDVLGECLCLCCRHNSGGGGPTDIWVMKKYGVKESWVKLASFSVYTAPLALSACGRRFLFLGYDWTADRCYLRWYDVVKQCTECFGSTNTTRPCHYPLRYCAQSLVRLPEKISQLV